MSYSNCASLYLCHCLKSTLRERDNDGERDASTRKYKKLIRLPRKIAGTFANIKINY